MQAVIVTQDYGLDLYKLYTFLGLFRNTCVNKGLDKCNSKTVSTCFYFSIEMSLLNDD